MKPARIELALALTLAGGLACVQPPGGEDTAGEASCFPLGPEPSAATPMTVRLVNSADSPRWAAALTCSASLLSLRDTAAGLAYADEVDLSCPEFPSQPNYYCGDPCDDLRLVAPIRVDPGASFSFAWDGHVWTSHEITPSCLPAEEQCADTCPTGFVPELGTALEMSVWSFARCEGEEGQVPPACACPGAVASCELDSHLSAELQDFAKVGSASFDYGGEAEILIDLGAV